MSDFKYSLIHKSKEAYDYALATLAFLIPIISKGLPLVILSAAILGMLYYVIAYRKVGKDKKDYVFLPYNLLKDAFSNIVKSKNTLLVMVSFFFYYMVSVIYSDNKDVAWSGVVLKSSFLYFPVLFSLTKWDVIKTKRLLDFFILGCLLNLLLSYITVAQEILIMIEEGQQINTIDYTHSSLSFSFHPSYISMYVNVAIIFNSIILFSSSFSESKMVVNLRIVSQILFSIFVIMLSSKSGLLTWFVAAGGSVIYLIIKTKQYFKSSIIIIVLGALFMITFNNFSIIGGRMNKMVNTIAKSEYKNEKQEYNSTGSRIGIWSASIELIMENSLFGVGVGDAKEVLMDKYLVSGLEQFHKLKHNSHNQFLDTGIAIGVIGIVLLLSILFFGCINYGKITFLILCVFGIVFGNLFVESMLERQGGAVFVAWLIALLVSTRPVLKGFK